MANAVKASTRLPVWEREDVVRYYAGIADLQAPEAVILAALDEQLPRMAVLDIGVGGGRTTAHLAPRAGRYVGVDSAPRMVDTCIARFGQDPPRRSFVVVDARTMPMFDDGTFDLVLFSYNGIDYVAPSERADVLVEMKRLTRPGGHVVFSTHNLNSNIEDQFALRHAVSLKGRIKQLIRQLYFRVLNPGFRRRQRRAHVMTLNDGAHWFAFRTCYTRSEAQVEQLRGLGFGEITVLALDGRAVEGSGLESVGDPWLYYWCRVPGSAGN